MELWYWQIQVSHILSHSYFQVSFRSWCITLFPFPIFVFWWFFFSFFLPTPYCKAPVKQTVTGGKEFKVQASGVHHWYRDFFLPDTWLLQKFSLFFFPMVHIEKSRSSILHTRKWRCVEHLATLNFRMRALITIFLPLSKDLKKKKRD